MNIFILRYGGVRGAPDPNLPHLERLLHFPRSEEPQVPAVFRGTTVRDFRREIGEGNDVRVDLFLVR